MAMPEVEVSQNLGSPPAETLMPRNIANLAIGLRKSMDTRYPGFVTRKEIARAALSANDLPNTSFTKLVIESDLMRLATNRKAQQEIIAAANQPPISEPIPQEPQKRGLLTKILGRHS